MPLLAFLVVALELVEALLSLEILRRTGRGKDFVAGHLDGSGCWFLWCLEDLEVKHGILEIGTPVSWIYIRFRGGNQYHQYNDIPMYWNTCLIAAIF